MDYNPFFVKRLEEKDPLQFNDMDRFRSRNLKRKNKKDNKGEDVKTRITEMLRVNSPSFQQDRFSGINANSPLSKLLQGNSAIGQAAKGGGNSGQNGRLPDNALVSIGGGHKLIPSAAAAWNRMVQDARAQGVKIGITDSYRTYDAQVRLAKQKGLYSQGGLAATPGKSKHGLGLAVDVSSGRGWLAKNAGRYGFSTIPREPWHWEYKG